ncbi:MAG: ATP-binding cassette domain-containing protein [Acidimicrobiia bacterium]|nr:ATP-binding cassette domain-containing protein [Acidimicrobiia bacterium]
MLRLVKKPRSAQRLLSRRPLTASDADQKLFVDRSDLGTVTTAVQLGLNTFLAGPAGSGKTTLLRALQRKLEDAGEEVKYVNVEPATPQTGLFDLIRIAIEPDERGNIGRRPYVYDLDDLDYTLGERYGKQPLTLLIDGVDEKETAELFGRHRDHLWALEQVRWVAASRFQGPLPPPADSFFDRVLSLEPFGTDEGRELLALRVPQVAKAVRDALTGAIGSAYPFVWVLAAQRLMMDSTSVEDVIAEFAAERGRAEQLPERFRGLYDAVIAVGPVHASDEDLLERVGASRSWTATALKHLESRFGLVRSKRVGRRVVYEALRSQLMADATSAEGDNA